MNTSMLSCFQSSPPNPTGGVVMGVKLSFLQDVIPQRIAMHSTGNIVDIICMIVGFLVSFWIRCKSVGNRFRRQLQYPSVVTRGNSSYRREKIRSVESV